MNSFNYLKTIRLLPFGLAVLVIAGLIFAPSVQAIVYLSNGGGGSGGSGEGDPLDANDYGGGGGYDDDYQDNHGVLPSVIGGGIVIQRAASDGIMYIIFDFQGTIPVLRVIQVSDAGTLLEEPDAR